VTLPRLQICPALGVPPANCTRNAHR
jgi:hypothetical protein